MSDITPIDCPVYQFLHFGHPIRMAEMDDVLWLSILDVVRAIDEPSSMINSYFGNITSNIKIGRKCLTEGMTGGDLNMLRLDKVKRAVEERGTTLGDKLFRKMETLRKLEGTPCGRFTGFVPIGSF
ncbi:hypothetical protein JCM17960_19900 [Magnetospira thiophila]